MEESFPTRERGLKHRVCLRRCSVILVVPYAGTWIETDCGLRCFSVAVLSFPTRERGLKHRKVGGFYTALTSSFPTRERGLKLTIQTG